MRIPPHVFVAPPEVLHDSMVAAFRRLGFGCLPAWTQTGCALFVHVDAATIRRCRYAVHDVRLELRVVDSCPLIRLDVRVYDRPDDPLRMDCFLNIQDEHSAAATEALTEQEWVVFHWYDERLQYVRSSAVHWRAENREAAREMISEARRIVAETGGGDFDRAKTKFMEANPI